VAFAGRSNVGKSSLINRLTRTTGLARTSRTPGRTQQVNFFVGSLGMAFADLPGYGFARVPNAVKAGFGPMVDGYLKSREELRGVIVLVDSRRGVSEIDQRMLAMAEAYDRPTRVVLSKVDKLGQSERARVRRETAKVSRDAVLFSVLTGEGVEELWGVLRDWAGLSGQARDGGEGGG
jgi:GTP-binding protein